MSSLKIHPTILKLLSAITTLPSAQHILVFGSVARLENNPCDLDVALVLPDCPGWVEALSAPNTKKTIQSLIHLARNNYGYLDPFVITQNEMMVRNANATGWTLTKNVRALKANIAKDGRPINEIMNILLAPQENEPDDPSDSRMDASPG